MTEATQTYRDAIRTGLRASLKSNPLVFLLGEDVGRYGGAFAVSKGLLEEFGPERIMDVPLSEAGFTGTAIGAAIAGMKPIAELMTVNFSLLALDQIINNAATLFHMTSGQVSVPVVIRISGGPGRQLAAQHSHSWEPVFAMIPGLKVLSAGTHEDAEAMLQLALKENDPVVIFEYTSMLNMEEFLISGKVSDISKAVIRKPGNHLSVITYGAGVHKSMKAAEHLMKSGIDAEILDLRILRPLDTETIISTARKTGKVIIVEDAWGTISVGSAIASLLYRTCFYDLEMPPVHLSGVEVPVPYPLHLEQLCTPGVDQIVEQAKKITGHE
jgi:pyruvate dehydrogenase E1 component beta subunit